MSQDFNLNFMDGWRRHLEKMDRIIAILENKSGESLVTKPEEKPKEECWCETWTFPEVINLTDSANRTIKPIFCPECGKKL